MCAALIVGLQVRYRVSTFRLSKPDQGGGERVAGRIVDDL
jgi:hypothetical protein